MNYQEAIDYVLALPDMERKKDGAGARVMSMDSMRELLRRLGNPQDGRSTVHVTGSKGKGSTSAFIASILHQAGRTVSFYSSPHMHDYTERIQINLEPVSLADFALGMSELQPAIEAVHESEFGPISTFGAMTSLYFHLTAKKQCQWQVVEVGLGGSSDATNVFAKKDIAVITAVSLEHMRILGNTPAEIAANKAGIITPGCTAIVARQKDPEVLPVVRDHCRNVGATCISVEEEYVTSTANIEWSGGKPTQLFSIRGSRGVRSFEISMLGRHQLDNATTAVAVADLILSEKESAGLPGALKAVRVPGRFEIVSVTPPVVLDGAHNQESAAALAQALQDSFPDNKWCIIVGANSDKNVFEILEALKPVATLVIATCSQSERAMPASEIAEHCSKLAIECTVADNIQSALLLARQSNLAVCVTGSLYLVAEARALNTSGHALSSRT